MTLDWFLIDWLWVFLGGALLGPFLHLEANNTCCHLDDDDVV